jgi:RNA polymerase sigma-70 factor (ECF subfamily)
MMKTNVSNGESLHLYTKKQGLEQEPGIEEIYHDFNKSLFAFIKSKVKHKEDAEDILHNVFLKIATHIHTLLRKEKLQNWLFRITRNAIIDYYRRPGKSSEPFEIDLIDKSEDSFDDAVEELTGCVKSFISKLPEKYREIVHESEIHGVRQKDLSEKFDMAYPSVRSRVQRGREKLKDLFLECCRIDLDSRGGIMNAVPRNNCPDNCDPCST